MRFGIGGAVLAGLFVPAWMQAMNLLTGGGLVPFNLISDDILLSTVFGGITAAGTIILAKRDEAKNPVAEGEMDRMATESLGPGETPVYATRERSKATESR